METRKSRLELQIEEKKEKQKKLFVIAGVLIGLIICAAAFGYMTTQQSEKPDNTVSQQTGANSTEPELSPEPLIPEVAEENLWMTRLVNSTSLLEDGYVPELVVVNSAGYKFDARAAEDLNAMMQAARDAGLSPMICSAYRSWERQNTLFDKQVVKQQNTGLPYEEAYEKAKTVVAFPGTSEHQTGLAMDISCKEIDYKLITYFERTKEGVWLKNNAHNYGFILRYPKGKEYLTGYNYESWHYRYLGRDMAKKVYESGLTYDEYYAFYIEK
jgi:D-alanyl-D-alanine carboxypeptidase